MKHQKMHFNPCRTYCWKYFFPAFLLFVSFPSAADLPQTVLRVKPAIVAIANVTSRSSSVSIAGTGFVIGDGRHVVTSYHVVKDSLPVDKKPVSYENTGNIKNTPVSFILVLPVHADQRRRRARIVASSAEHDLAVLAIEGSPLPTVSLQDKEMTVFEGTEIAITGFPLAGRLGLNPATNKGIISALTYNRTSVPSAAQLTVTNLDRLRFSLYQLDMIAYPGNSGSPVYRIDTGKVIGILAGGLVKEKKTATLTSRVTEISFAIPVRYLHELLQSIKMEEGAGGVKPDPDAASYP